MRNTVTFNSEHFDILRSHLLHDDGLERVAYVIFGRSYVESDPWTNQPEERFLSKEVIILPDEELIESTTSKVSWKTDSFIHVLRKAELKNFAVAIVHNHPNSFKQFSSVDNENEPDFFKIAFNRNGGTRPHLSLVLTPDGYMFGRTWNSALKSSEIDFIRILGDRFKFIYPNRDKKYITPEAFNRQQLAFGNALIQDLSKLQIGIVGCGATGSATATLLSHLGVGKLLLVDKDTLDASNLNRLHGAKLVDVGKPKVEILKNEMVNVGLGTKVQTIQDWVSSDKAKDALKSCDIVFGCTDDNAGRLFLNRFAYFYLVPVIDMGLAITVSEAEPPQIRDLNGRMTVLFPNTTCLICNGVIDGAMANAENLKRNDPIEYEIRKKEAYVLGENNPSPSVITFTTEVATMAVNEFIHRIQGFRTSGSVDHRIRLFHRDTDLRPSNNSRAECRICSSNHYWGRGDMTPFMDVV